MAKIVLEDLQNLNNQQTSVVTINNNSAAIETAFENTLSRDGTEPNSMLVDLDMNSKRILNLPAPLHPTDPVRVQDISGSGFPSPSVITGNGIIARTSPDMFTGRTLIGAEDEIIITNGNGIAGNPTIGLHPEVMLAVETVAILEEAIGDIGSAEDSAYEAQQYALDAAASALSARLSQAKNFPIDFIDGTKYWTQGNGQISSPTVAANNPLHGTFVEVDGVGTVHQTVYDPETCDSIGPISLIAGVPGTNVRISARVRAITELSNGAVDPNIGVSILPLNADFSLVEFIEGAGLGTLTVSDGWQEVTFNYTIPEESDVLYGTYYRPTLFYNVVGSASPLTPSLDTQGNQQFQIAWFKIVVVSPDAQGLPNLVNLTSGSGNWTPSVGCLWAEVHQLGAGGGGGGGGGSGATDGGNGGDTSLGTVIAGGGEKGGGFAGGYANGGATGTATPPSSNFTIEPTSGGANSSGGYTYAAGGMGGGGGTAVQGGVGSTPPANSGIGGAGGGAQGTAGPGAGGGQGARIRYIIYNPDERAYSIGAGGTAGTAGTGGAAGAPGASGCITIVEHFK